MRLLNLECDRISKSGFLIKDVWYDITDWLTKFDFDNDSFSRYVSQRRAVLGVLVVVAVSQLYY